MAFIAQHPEDYILFIVDENLDVHDNQIASTKEGTISGSMCVSKIRQKLLPDQESRILMLIRSANDSASDVAIYNSRAHGYLPKAPIKPDNVLEELAPLWLNRFPPSTCRLKPVHSDYHIPDLSEKSELATTARDLIENVTEISTMISNESDLSNHWANIWEKLHVLKGDLLTLSHENKQNFSFALETIDAMRGPTMPDDLKESWELVCTKITNAL